LRKKLFAAFSRVGNETNPNPNTHRQYTVKKIIYKSSEIRTVILGKKERGEVLTPLRRRISTAATTMIIPATPPVIR